MTIKETIFDDEKIRIITNDSTLNSKFMTLVIAEKIISHIKFYSTQKDAIRGHNEFCKKYYEFKKIKLKL
jgi:hypothetical protein